MQKPTLKQIFDFVLQRVETEYIIENTNGVTDKKYESCVKRFKKRYPKQIGIFVAHDYYGYSGPELQVYLNLTKAGVYTSLHAVRISNSKKEVADELFDSLNILYGTKNRITLDAYMSKILPIFANENNSGVRSINDLSKLEIWLINRLYETENK